ncbi:MAG: hypothetical protein MRERV_46c029 [Mycoplasmataceae bacterium RV_VA103A]|nr:MAG: hypothetical protein MRERV_46c029 [Mycoplasmataceae bacterium RV_VA103A]
MKLENKAGKGQINTFINQVLEEKLITEGEQLKKKLIAGYKRVAKNKKLQKEVEIWDETLNDAWKERNE